MKKVICSVLTLVLILTTCAYCFGAVEPEKETVDPRYVTANSVQSRVVVTEGTASYYVRLEKKSGQTISYIKATLKLVNSKGTVVKTKTDTIYESGLYFKLSDSKVLTTKGKYHAEYTLKVYRTGTLVETITGQSADATY